jgi:hypothetical protein
MKKVFILSSCDAWHSYSSFRTIGAFSDLETLVRYLKKYDKVSEYDIEQICSIGQTQGRKMNYIVETLDVNPIIMSANNH